MGPSLMAKHPLNFPRHMVWICEWMCAIGEIVGTRVVVPTRRLKVMHELRSTGGLETVRCQGGSALQSANGVGPAAIAPVCSRRQSNRWKYNSPA